MNLAEGLDRYLCECGHTLDRHPACSSHCGCEEFVFDALMDDCGHIHGECHCERLPVIRAKREVDDRWVVDCPYCGNEHTHGAEAGDRVAHCLKGDYVITSPIRPRSKLPFRRVWDRDGWQCVRCGTHKNLTVDHILPVSRGGTDELANLQTMCGSCNSSKGDRV